MSTAGVLRAAYRAHFDIFLIKAFDELHRGEPPLVLAGYLQAIAYDLQRVAIGDERRLVITVPPRHLKSVTAAVAFPAWLLGRDPTAKIMVAHYSHDLSRAQANLCRQIMEAGWYRELFPNASISARGNRATELVTTLGGGRKAVSVGGSITGFGADLIILDDCMKADEVRSPVAREAVRSWFDNTLLSRLNDKRNGRVISIQQRLHEDDLPAYMLDKGYRHLNLPAIATEPERHAIGPGQFYARGPGDVLNPAREDQEVLASIRREIGPTVFAAQYQQNPVVPEGNLLRMEWFGTYDEAPPRETFGKVVQSWDTAYSEDPSADYSVGLTWGFKGRAWYLLDVYRRQVDFPALRQALLDQRERWQPDMILIEKAGSGRSLGQDLRKTLSVRIVACPPETDKVARVAAVSAEIEGCDFLLPREAPWLAAFRAEIRAFPDGRYDDQVDALSQFVKWQQRNWEFLLQEFTPSGRLKDHIRRQTRPWGPGSGHHARLT